MDNNIILNDGDTVVLSNGVELKVEYADTDGSGCHCCDNGICKCLFLTVSANDFCNKNYCDCGGAWIDTGPKLVFTPIDKTKQISIYEKSKNHYPELDFSNVDIAKVNGKNCGMVFESNRYKLKHKQ